MSARCKSCANRGTAEVDSNGVCFVEIEQVAEAGDCEPASGALPRPPNMVESCLMAWVWLVGSEAYMQVSVSSRRDEAAPRISWRMSDIVRLLKNAANCSVVV